MCVAPEFAPHDRGTDWNDYAARHGLVATRAAILRALRRGATVKAWTEGEEAA